MKNNLKKARQSTEHKQIRHLKILINKNFKKDKGVSIQIIYPDS